MVGIFTVHYPIFPTAFGIGDHHRFCQIKHLYAQQGLTASQIANALSLDPSPLKVRT